MRHKVFWGFQTEISSLYRASQVWQETRTLRLARLRHASATHARATLASLPNEIMTMIENAMILDMHARPIVSCWPFTGECQCDSHILDEEFFARAETYETFVEWCYDNEIVDGEMEKFPSDAIRVEAWRNQFRRSGACEELLYDFYCMHDDSCPGIVSFHLFWFYLAKHASTDKSKVQEPEHIDQTIEVTLASDLIQTFLNEHGFQCMPVAEESLDGPYTLVILACSDTLRNTSFPLSPNKISRAQQGRMTCFAKKFNLDHLFEGPTDEIAWNPAKLGYLAVDLDTGSLYEERGELDFQQEKLSDTSSDNGEA